MKLLGEFHQLDWAVLCIGDNFTMGHQDAAICAASGILSLFNTT